MIYSITIDGTKNPVNKSCLTSDDMLAGYDVVVEIGPAGRIHGQVAAGASKKMVWIPQVTGSNIPGRWVEEGSAEARAAVHHNLGQIRSEDLTHR